MENTITSTKNPHIKEINKLNEGKYRNKTGLFLVESEKCVLEASFIIGLIHEVLIVASEAEKYAHFDFENISYVSKDVMDYVAPSKTPQGILAVCDREKLSITSDQPLIVALDGISDPGNLGAIIRSADAVCAGKVLLLNHCVDYLSPKVIRASMGSVFHVDIRKAESSVLCELKKQGYHVLGAHLEGKENLLLDHEKNCVVIGNEAHGISDDVFLMLDEKVKIPIYGKAESLNAAVAASILMYKIKGY